VRTRDRNGVILTVGMRVERGGQVGRVSGLLGPYRVYVVWENNEPDDEIESADTLTTVSATLGPRRRSS
jgi:hypothetical protein